MESGFSCARVSFCRVGLNVGLFGLSTCRVVQGTRAVRHDPPDLAESVRCAQFDLLNSFMAVNIK